jgi:hypothetical protein
MMIFYNHLENGRHAHVQIARHATDAPRSFDPVSESRVLCKILLEKSGPSLACGSGGAVRLFTRANAAVPAWPFQRPAGTVHASQLGDSPRAVSWARCGGGGCGGCGCGSCGGGGCGGDGWAPPPPPFRRHMRHEPVHGRAVCDVVGQETGGQFARQLRSVQQPVHDGSPHVGVSPLLRGLLPLPRFRGQPFAGGDVSVEKTTPEAAVGRDRCRTVHAIARNTGTPCRLVKG